MCLKNDYFAPCILQRNNRFRICIIQLLYFNYVLILFWRGAINEDLRENNKICVYNDS